MLWPWSCQNQTRFLSVLSFSFSLSQLIFISFVWVVTLLNYLLVWFYACNIFRKLRSITSTLQLSFSMMLQTMWQHYLALVITCSCLFLQVNTEPDESPAKFAFFHQCSHLGNIQNPKWASKITMIVLFLLHTVPRRQLSRMKALCTKWLEQPSGSNLQTAPDSWVGFRSDYIPTSN